MPIKVIQWDLDAWEDYLYWQSQDKKNLKKINKLSQVFGVGELMKNIDLFTLSKMREL